MAFEKKKQKFPFALCSLLEEEQQKGHQIDQLLLLESTELTEWISGVV